MVDWKPGMNPVSKSLWVKNIIHSVSAWLTASCCEAYSNRLRSNRTQMDAHPIEK